MIFVNPAIVSLAQTIGPIAVISGSALFLPEFSRAMIVLCLICFLAQLASRVFRPSRTAPSRRFKFLSADELKLQEWVSSEAWKRYPPTIQFKSSHAGITHNDQRNAPEISGKRVDGRFMMAKAELSHELAHARAYVAALPSAVTYIALMALSLGGEWLDFPRYVVAGTGVLVYFAVLWADEIRCDHAAYKYGLGQELWDALMEDEKESKSQGWTAWLATALAHPPLRLRKFLLRAHS